MKRENNFYKTLLIAVKAIIIVNVFVATDTLVYYFTDLLNFYFLIDFSFSYFELLRYFLDAYSVTIEYQSQIKKAGAKYLSLAPVLALVTSIIFHASYGNFIFIAYDIAWFSSGLMLKYIARIIENIIR
ncbi:hypothetical protein [Pontimicrobium sp. MEBiC01747]